MGDHIADQALFSQVSKTAEAAADRTDTGRTQKYGLQGRVSEEFGDVHLTVGDSAEARRNKIVLVGDSRFGLTGFVGGQ